MDIKIDEDKIGELETFELGEKRPPKIQELPKRLHQGIINLNFKCPSCGSDPDVDCICKGQNR